MRARSLTIPAAVPACAAAGAGQRRGARAGSVWVLAALLGVACAGVAAQGTREAPLIEGGTFVDDDAPPPPGSRGTVLTPDDGARAPADGPAVELITGGNSTDGAARVGRLPVLD